MGQKLPWTRLSEKSNQHRRASGQYSSKEAHGSRWLNSPNCKEISVRPECLSSINHLQFEATMTQSRVRCLNVEVENFLSSSQPSLVHLTRRLVEIGCYSEQDLFAIASLNKDKRYKSLKALMTGVSEMDILFFEHRLDIVFSYAKGRESR